jgi:hypothetical protein
MSLLNLHFADVMARLEDRAAAGLAPRAVFEGVDDDLFALIAGKGFDGYPALRALLPDYPDHKLVGALTGNRSLAEAMKEASFFWRLAKAQYAQHGRRPLGEARVVDYGAGWGRITRLCDRDVGELIAVEPNPVFQDEFRRIGAPGRLIASDYMSAAPLDVGGADLLFSFSILTHTSEALARNVRDRWAEIMAPGGVVVCTIRPGTFLDGARGEIRQLAAADLAAGRAAYAAGRIAYWPYPETPDFGITVMPMDFLRDLFGRDFEILGPRFLLENPTQLPIVMIRR